jgi:hypothetical protein
MASRKKSGGVRETKHDEIGFWSEIKLDVREVVNDRREVVNDYG